MENTPALKNRVKELHGVVRGYSNGKTPDSEMSVQDILSSPKMYIAIPVIVLLLLALSKPSFLYTEGVDKKTRFSTSKLILFWLLLSSVLCVGVFGYNYKIQN
jgi:hypothetical protein